MDGQRPSRRGGEQTGNVPPAADDAGAGSAMKREKEDYLIQSVSHALDILESFTRTDKELGVTELSKRLGLHKNNVFRLLATLEHRGYIEQNRKTENYRLGPRTLQLGAIFIEQRECRRQARPLLEGLMAATGETAVVAVLRADKVVYMDGVETDRTVRAVSRVGAILPSCCTAVGKIQLAFLPTTEIERLYPEPDLPAVTERSLRSRAALLADLEISRQQGFAVENEECDLEVRGIAAPVRDVSGTVIAALGIISPASRLSDDRIRKDGVGALVQAAAVALSAKLGYLPPAGPASAPAAERGLY
jgi:IclR family transcriptional regulator, KDG regulon repressor